MGQPGYDVFWLNVTLRPMRSHILKGSLHKFISCEQHRMPLKYSFGCTHTMPALHARGIKFLSPSTLTCNLHHREGPMR